MKIRKKLLSFISLIVLVSCGGGGGGGGEPTPAPPPSPPASVNLSADPLSVLLGDQTTLTWTTANASTCTASGAWSGNKSSSGSEDVTIQVEGNNVFTLTCSGPGGSGSDSVSVEGYENITGVSVDGYLRNASIFQDKNDNFLLDDDELSSVTNDSGGFVLREDDSPDLPLISLGGVDIDTEKNFEDLLLINRSGDIDFKSITPITSVASFMNIPEDIYSILNIQDSIDIYSYDPVANKNNDFESSLVYEKGNQLTILAYSVQSVVNAQLASEDTTQDYFSFIAQELEAKFLQTSEPINIEDESFILSVIEKSLQEKSIELTETVKTNMAKALSSVMTLIQVRELQAADIALFNFATSTLVTDLISIADGSASTDLIASYDTESISEYIASSEGLPQEDLTPEIRATNDFVSIDEDTSITFNVLANDSIVAGVPVDLVVEGSDDGSVTSSNGNVTFVPSQDFNGTTTFGYSISQSVYGGLTSDALIFIEVRPINDVPQITTPNSLDINENETFVVTLQADDADGDDITFSKNGDDADEFNLGSDTGDLEFIEAPDFEERNLYNVITVASDGVDSSEKNIAINIIDLDDTAPEINPPLEFAAEENQSSIGQITATDTDTDDNEITYSISGSEILISSETGVLTFQEEPDFETKNEYNASVTATDGTNSSTEEILVQITNINDNSPAFTSSEVFAVEENQLAIGLVEANDADGDNLSFSTNSSEISINSETGELAFVEEPDYETKSSYSVTVAVTDAVFSATQDIGVDIINLNDNSPVFNSDVAFTTNENETAIGTASATDADGDTLTYSISGSEISIDSATGVMSFVAAPDYETKTAYEATLTVSDSSFSSTENISITINDLNDNNPEFISSSTFSVPEEEIFIGTIQATDADANTQVIYTTDSDLISVDNSSGELNFLIQTDYESVTQYAFNISASDGENITTEVITVNIDNINDNEPEIISSATFNADENQTNIGKIEASDADGDSLTYSIVSADIVIDSNGVLTFLTPPDYETQTAYNATVGVTDGFFSATQQITVNIGNLEDNAPVYTGANEFFVDENQTAIGTVTATDADGSDLSFSISNPDISIDNATGIMAFVSAPDYEQQTEYSETIQITDGTLTTNADINIFINNLNDNTPELTSGTTYSADENQTAIGTVTATDADGDVIIFSISGSEINIDSSTGVLTFVEAPDYETKSTYTATVTASDGTNSTTQELNISINNINDNEPVITSGATFSADENQTIDVGFIVATDADGDSLGYGIDNNIGDGTEINVNSTTGEITFASAPDYETKSSYSGTVRVYEVDGGNVTTQDITITINNLDDESPVFSSSNSFVADENQTAIGTVTASDADGDPLVFSITDNNTDIKVLIDANSGVLTFSSAPDRETTSSYTETVTVTDGVYSASQQISIELNDIDDNAPTIGTVPSNGIIYTIENHRKNLKSPLLSCQTFLIFQAQYFHLYMN